MLELFEAFRATIESAMEADETLTLADVNTALDLAKSDLLNIILTTGDDEGEEAAAE